MAQDNFVFPGQNYYSKMVPVHIGGGKRELQTMDPNRSGAGCPRFILSEGGGMNVVYIYIYCASAGTPVLFYMVCIPQQISQSESG